MKPRLFCLPIGGGSPLPDSPNLLRYITNIAQYAADSAIAAQIFVQFVPFRCEKLQLLHLLQLLQQLCGLVVATSSP